MRNRQKIRRNEADYMNLLLGKGDKKKELYREMRKTLFNYD